MVDKIISPRRDEQITVDGIPTTRHSLFLESLSNQTNDTSDLVLSMNDNTALSLLFSLESRIGSGDFLTSDETGFTVDSTKLTVDQTEA